VLVSSGVLQVVVLLVRAVINLFRSQRELSLENVALRHQLEVTLRKSPRPRLKLSDRALCVVLSRLWSGWRRQLRIVKPETVIGWHRKGWRLYWTWRSRSLGGRPRLSPEVRALIAEMWRENPLWGSERIRGELEKLGIVVSNRSIRRYRWANRLSGGSQRWRTFLMNELKHCPNSSLNVSFSEGDAAPVELERQ
jgi:putative transposase